MPTSMVRSSSPSRVITGAVVSSITLINPIEGASLEIFWLLSLESTIFEKSKVYCPSVTLFSTKTGSLRIVWLPEDMKSLLTV